MRSISSCPHGRPKTRPSRPIAEFLSMSYRRHGDAGLSGAREFPLRQVDAYVACFGPVDMDLSPEDRHGLFSRNSRTRFAEVTDGLSQTMSAGERTNAVYLSVIGSSNHFDLETVWPGAIKENPADDHAHTTLFSSAYLINNPNFDDRDSMSYHTGGSNYLFGDGSVRFLKLSIDLRVYQSLGSRAGGELVASEQY